MSLAVKFENVSKKFTLHSERPRSIQEIFVNLFRSSENVSKKDLWVLKDVNFEIEAGESVGFIGVNGAGKSTILKLISQVLMPTSGRIEINGRVGALLEVGTGFHPDMTGRENIYLNASILGFDREQIDRKLKSIIDFAEIGQFIDIPVKHYSSGMYVRLGFAVVIHIDPDILLIDEVLSVGDVAFQRKCIDTIYDLKKRGITILYVSHDPGSVERLCEQAIWFEKGEIRLGGEARDVLTEYTKYTYAQKGARIGFGGMEELEPKGTEALEVEEIDFDLEEPEAEKRWGSGEVLIESLRFLDHQEQETDLFRTGELMVIEMQYCANTKIENPVFGLAVHRNDGIHISGPNTQISKINIPSIEGRGLVRYTIPALNLLAGTYLLSVAVTDWSTAHLFDYHDQLYQFKVAPDEAGEQYGFLTLQGNWTVESGGDRQLRQLRSGDMDVTELKHNPEYPA